MLSANWVWVVIAPTVAQTATDRSSTEPRYWAALLMVGLSFLERSMSVALVCTSAVLLNQQTRVSPGHNPLWWSELSFGNSRVNLGWTLGAGSQPLHDGPENMQNLPRGLPGLLPLQHSERKKLLQSAPST
jgi:hypothetical protein